MTEISYRDLADLTGRIGMRDVPCPLCGPGRREPANRKRKVLRVWHKEPGFATYLCARCGASGFAHDETKPLGASVTAEAKPAATIAPAEIVAVHDDANERFERAKRLWRESVPLSGTLGHRYFTEHRKLDIDKLGDLSRALRWHQGVNAVIAKMTDAVTNKATGVHRTFLNADGTNKKNERGDNDRKMLGKVGVIRLSPDEDVMMGIGITEGVEDGLAVLLSLPWAPVWAATSAIGIEKFPVISGIECLTVHADLGDVGKRAALTCLGRWKAAGKEAVISFPHFIQKELAA
jgi:hypothetical protein